MSTALTIPNDPVELMVRKDWEVSFIPTLELAIEAAVCSSSLVTRVDSDATNALQVAAVARLDVLIRGIESARKAHKEPFLKAGQHIDSIAKAASETLLEEKARLVKLASDHRQKVLDDARELESERVRKLQEEERRIREEQLARDRERFRIEEAKRLEIEALQKKAQSEANEKKRAKLQAEADARAAAEAERLRLADIEAERQRQANQMQLQAIASEPVPQAPQADGQRWKDQWDWRSLNLFQLATRYGDRFVTFAEKRQPLMEFINGPDCPRKKDGTPDLPGDFYRVSKQQVRQPAARKAIDV